MSSPPTAAGDVPRYTLRQLAYLVSAAELGTTSAAADVHVMSQSAMSSALTDLERAFGLQLLVRSKARGVRPTAAGHRLLPQIRALLEAAGELEASARDLGEALSGRLIIGCHVSIAPYLLPRLLRDFETHHPEVELDFVEASNPELESLLFDGRCEVAITYDLQTHPRVGRELLYTAHHHVLLPGGHRLNGQDSVSLAELAPEPVVFLDVPPAEPMFLGVFAAAGVTPNVRYRTVSFEHARALVAHGLAYTLVAHRIHGRPPWGPEVISKPLVEDVPRLPIVIIRAAGVRPTRRARAFTEFCLATLREPPGA